MTWVGAWVVAGDEDGQHHGDVGKMRSACIGIVEDGDVARRKDNRRDGCLHGHRHGAQMDRHVIAHRDYPALAVENGAGIIAPLFDIGRERGAAQGGAHLLGNGMHGTLEDGEVYWVRFGGIGCGMGHAGTVMTIFR